jgi:hypothetical protein
VGDVLPGNESIHTASLFVQMVRPSAAINQVTDGPVTAERSEFRPQVLAAPIFLGFACHRRVLTSGDVRYGSEAALEQATERTAPIGLHRVWRSDRIGAGGHRASARQVMVAAVLRAPPHLIARRRVDLYQRPPVQFMLSFGLVQVPMPKDGATSSRPCR